MSSNLPSRVVLRLHRVTPLGRRKCGEQRLALLQRARARWGKIRAHAVYAVLARALLSAHMRAAERLYAPGGAGYVHAREDFEARADKLPRLM